MVVAGWGTFRSFDGLRAFLPLWLFALVAVLVHAVVAPSHLPYETVETVAHWGIMLAIAGLFFQLLDDGPARAGIETAFVASAAVVGALGLIQYTGAAPWLFPVFPNYDQRVYSVFGNQDLFGGYMSVGVVTLLMRVPATGRGTAARAATFVLLMAALLLSGSRTAWLAAAAGIALLLGHADLRRPVVRLCLVAGVPVALALAVLVPGATVQRVVHVFGADDQGAWLRLWIWDGALRMAGEHPIAGVGPGNFAYWSPRYLGEALHEHPWRHHNEVHTLHAESEPLNVAAEMGAVGVALLLWQFARIAKYRGPVWAPWIAVIVFASFNAIQHSMPHMLWGLFLAATMLRQTREAALVTRCAPLAYGLVLVMTGAVVVFCTVIPGALYRDADRAAAVDESKYQRALDYPWPNHEAELSWGMALLERREDHRAHEYLERASRGVDTGALHLALAVLAWERHDTERCRGHVKACLRRWPDNLDAWRLRILSAKPSEMATLRVRATQWLPREDVNALFEPGAKRRGVRLPEGGGDGEISG